MVSFVLVAFSVVFVAPFCFGFGMCLSCVLSFGVVVVVIRSTLLKCRSCVCVCSAQFPVRELTVMHRDQRRAKMINRSVVNCRLHVSGYRCLFAASVG